MTDACGISCEQMPQGTFCQLPTIPMTHLEDLQETVPVWLHVGMKRSNHLDFEDEDRQRSLMRGAKLTYQDHESEINVIETVYSSNNRVAVLLEQPNPNDIHVPYDMITLSVNLPEAPCLEGTFFVEKAGVALLIVRQLMEQNIMSFVGEMTDGYDDYVICRLCS